MYLFGPSPIRLDFLSSTYVPLSGWDNWIRLHSEAQHHINSGSCVMIFGLEDPCELAYSIQTCVSLDGFPWIEFVSSWVQRKGGIRHRGLRRHYDK